VLVPYSVQELFFDRYKEYIKSKIPKENRLGAPSPFWYIYSPDTPKEERDVSLLCEIKGVLFHEYA
jgi:hypothetical protein